MKKRIVLLPSGGNNLHSIQDALESMGYTPYLTAKESDIRSADKVIVPGVGRARRVMDTLEQLGLTEVIPTLTQEVLGICVGMQILFRRSEEDHQKCLGIISSDVKKFPSRVVIPHMGWNQLQFSVAHPLLSQITTGEFVYFTHSYFAPVDADYTLVTSAHDDIEMAAIVQSQNFYGVQFHPERSGKTGWQLLKNFIHL